MPLSMEEEEAFVGLPPSCRDVVPAEVGSLLGRPSLFLLLTKGLGAAFVAAVVVVMLMRQSPTASVAGKMHASDFVSFAVSQEGAPPPGVPPAAGAVPAAPAPAPPPPEGEPKSPPFSPLLFCWAMVRSVGYEPDLLSAQFYNKAGIFGCESHTVFSNGGLAHVADAKVTEVVAPESSMGDFADEGTATSSWLNTLVFFKAWEMVIADGKWWTSDWTVKVDPDAVFFPHRLAERIEQHTSGLNAEPTWVGNCDRIWHPDDPKMKLFGSLEIFSRNAIGTYKAFGQQCRDELPWKGWGEDMFMQECMKKLKVRAINGTDYLGDKRCHDAPCTDINKVVFHDFKQVDTFFQCWGQSMGSERVYLEEQERLRKIAEQQRREAEEAARLARIAQEKQEAEEAARLEREEQQRQEEAARVQAAVEAAEQERGRQQLLAQEAAQKHEQEMKRKAAQAAAARKQSSSNVVQLGHEREAAKAVVEELFIRK